MFLECSYFVHFLTILTYFPTNLAVLESSDPVMKGNMFEALKDMVTAYSKRMVSDTLGPILQAHIVRTLINQKLDIIQEWERLCFIQQEVSRIQRYNHCSLFP